MTALEELAALEEAAPEDEIGQAISWLRWCVVQRVLGAGAGEHTRERLRGMS